MHYKVMTYTLPTVAATFDTEVKEAGEGASSLPRVSGCLLLIGVQQGDCKMGNSDM